MQAHQWLRLCNPVTLLRMVSYPPDIGTPLPPHGVEYPQASPSPPSMYPTAGLATPRRDNRWDSTPGSGGGAGSGGAGAGRGAGMGGATAGVGGDAPWSGTSHPGWGSGSAGPEPNPMGTPTTSSPFGASTGHVLDGAIVMSYVAHWAEKQAHTLSKNDVCVFVPERLEEFHLA